MVSLFGNKNENGRTLRPRARRATPLMDVGLAVIAGAVTGVYIFQDTLQRWRITEDEAANAGNTASTAHKATTQEPPSK
ncbi:unnamed protein product [Hyaloperonospora brassicae]|uniref:RxLR effector candidate protein n=1 Tax=Hyaloperonospora brassicae TaxID=162125 RepID=A0AAV0V0U4_HYABA|nr:unnamed protein product [Hyaloperonospora brassicae]